MLILNYLPPLWLERKAGCYTEVSLLSIPFDRQ